MNQKQSKMHGSSVIRNAMIGGSVFAVLSIVIIIVAKICAENLLYLVALPIEWLIYFTGWNGLCFRSFLAQCVCTVIVNGLCGAFLFVAFSICERLGNEPHRK
jgi:hypothetical protein